MAKVDLLPRKEFDITLDDGTLIKGQFGTWAMKRYCDKNKLSLGEAGTALTTLGGLIDFMLCAVEYKARQGGTAFSYTDIHACQWIDEMGGMNSENFTNLMKHSQDETQQAEVADEEKKTDS